VKLEVTLAGCTLPWVMGDGVSLEDWLARRPWLEQGGVLLVRVAAGDSRTRTLDGLRQATRAANDGGCELALEVLEQPGGELLTRLLELRGLAVDPRAFQRLDDLARDLVLSPCLFILRPGTTTCNEFELLYEQLAKHRRQPAPTFLVLDEWPRPFGGAPCDLSHGSPARGLLEESAEETRELRWRRYLHHRLAWEVGGDPELRLPWPETRVARLRPGDDDGLEHLLNNGANLALAQLPAELREALQQHVAPTTGPTGGSPKGARPARVEAPEEVLLRAGLLCHTPASPRPRLMPWLARALLLQDPQRRAAAGLRAAVVCQPIAAELLLRCLRLEAQERARCGIGDAQLPVPPDLEERWRRFQQGHVGSGREFYPRGCPATPGQAWDIASLGEVLFALGASAESDRAKHDLRGLRNALAHGHYASWRSVEQLVRLEQELGGHRTVGRSSLTSTPKPWS